MESKTEHIRRMRLRVRYWRVTPESESMFKLGKVEMMCDATSRELLAALIQLVDRVQEVTRGPDHAGFGAGFFEPEMAEARSAIRKARAAGIKGKQP